MKIKLLLPFMIIAISLFSCQSKEKQEESKSSELDKAVYLERGQKIAGATFTALSSKLQAAMQEGGVVHAIEYCNLAAYPLVDSLSKVHQATIRRTSTKVRNEKDTPTTAELAVLEEYQKMAEEGEALKPIVKELNQEYMAFYAPIRINASCLQCHGKVGETLLEENHALIKELYPNDKAIGYSDGDFRGIWSIKLKK